MSKECSYYLSNFNHVSSSTNAAFGIKPSSEYPTGTLCFHNLYQIRNILIRINNNTGILVCMLT